MNIHTVTLPNGKTNQRSSQNRTYTHVVVVEFLGGKWDYVNGQNQMTFVPDGTQQWGAHSWAGSFGADR